MTSPSDRYGRVEDSVNYGGQDLISLAKATEGPRQVRLTGMQPSAETTVQNVD